MTYLQIVNGALMALGAAMTTVLAVVCLLLWLHVETAPQLAGSVGAIGRLTGAFALLATIAGIAFWGVRRRRPWLWAAEGSAVAAMLAVIYLAAVTAGL